MLSATHLGYISEVPALIELTLFNNKLQFYGVLEGYKCNGQKKMLNKKKGYGSGRCTYNLCSVCTFNRKYINPRYFLFAIIAATVFLKVLINIPNTENSTV